MVAFRSAGCWLALTLAAWSAAQTPFLAKVRPAKGDPYVVVVNSSGSKQVPDSAKDTPLSWSPDGRWVVLGQPEKDHWRLSLLDLTRPDLAKCPLTGLCSKPSWSPSGKSFVVSVAGGGLRKCEVSGSDPVWSPLLSNGSSPSWSPSGGRIAFIGPKSGPSGWIVDDEGGEARAFYKPAGAERLAWARDGKSLALVVSNKQGRQLVITSASGSETRNVGKVQSDEVEWSPDGQSILAKQNGLWIVASTLSNRVQETPFQTSMPQWQDSKTLLGTQDGKLGEWTLAKGSFTPLTEVKLESVEAVVAFRGLVLEGSQTSNSSTKLKPKAGQIAVVGTVKSVEIEDETAEIVVWSVLTPDGMELNLAKPLVQTVQITSQSTRQGPKGTVKLSSAELFVDGEFAALLRGDKAGVPGALNVEYAVVPELLEATIASDNALSHPVRNLEYDGVCMDQVVVPMVFPVLGKVSWSDTFLANRDGGSRRHHGQDLMAPKMQPLVAVFDGVVRFNRSPKGHNTITLRGDNGWTAVYMHVNNDTPGTDDGKGGDRYAFAPGLKTGDRVVQGQLVGFCGDSGNAENTGPHCHFELHDEIGGGVLNAAPSLQDSERISQPVTVTPNLAMTLKDGETRWDVVVRKLDQERNVIVADLVATGAPGQAPMPSLSPRLVYIKALPSTQFGVRNEPGASRSFQDIKPGQFVSVLGPAPKTSSALEARYVGLGFGLRD